MELLRVCTSVSGAARVRREPRLVELQVNPLIFDVAVPAEDLPLLTANVLLLHVGDLRSPHVGDLTTLLERRLRHLKVFLQRNPNLRGIVVHAESALGWGDGEREARREFWELLRKELLDEVWVYIENNVLVNPKPRYEFVRNPEFLIDEVTAFGLQLALDTSHAGWFYQGQMGRLLALVEAGVGHLHLSDWAPGGAGQHLPLGKGCLDLRGVLARYNNGSGRWVTLEVPSRSLSAAVRFLDGLG